MTISVKNSGILRISFEKRDKFKLIIRLTKKWILKKKDSIQLKP